MRFFVCSCCCKRVRCSNNTVSYEKGKYLYFMMLVFVGDYALAA